MPRPRKRVLSYALFGGWEGAPGYGGTHHSVAQYAAGARVNAARAAALLPGWTVRVHYDASVPAAVLEGLRGQSSLELVRVTDTDLGAAAPEDDPRPQTRSRSRPVDYAGTLWRLLPYDDPTVAVTLSRDLDDAIDADAAEVAQAFARDRCARAHRQRAADRYPVNAGWFGIKAGALPLLEWGSMRAQVAAWLASGDRAYCTDERFLSFVVWPALEARWQRRPRALVALPHSRPAVPRSRPRQNGGGGPAKKRCVGRRALSPSASTSGSGPPQPSSPPTRPSSAMRSSRAATAASYSAGCR